VHKNQPTALQSCNCYPNENNRGRQYGYNLHPGTLHTAKQSGGNTKKYKMFTAGDGRRAAVVVTNKQIDGMLINELSEADTVAVAVLKESLKFIITRRYFDRGNLIELDQVKVDAVLEHEKWTGIMIAMDSNSRSNLWYDTATNTRGRILEEYVTSNHLNIMEEDRSNTTFKIAVVREGICSASLDKRC
jgi:hypothetical protein